MSKPVAIVAALRREMAPLSRGAKLREVDGVYLFELPSALVAIGGIGRDPALRAAELAVREAAPRILISAGIAGALTPELKAGHIIHIREVVDEVTGDHYPALDGDAVLVTASYVAGIEAKRRLATRFAASAVDMEAAAVARVAREQGIPFAAVKVISDELEFPMPPTSAFIDAQGRFRELAFAGFVAVRPKWWLSTIRMAKQSQLAIQNLGHALDHLIQQHTESTPSETETLV